MLQFNNGFIGYKPNTSEEFIGLDSKELYQKNLTTKDASWYYRKKPILYNYNNLGHRSKNIENLNLDNYILFIGCSHTEGTGNYIEDTFPFIVSKLLCIDYYNIGLGGSGLDVMFYNLAVWMQKIEKKPKKIIWQWAEPTRFLTIEKEEVHIHGIWEKKPEVENFIFAGYENGFSASRISLLQQYLKQINIPITLLAEQFSTYPADILYKKIDIARDDKHYGVESNKNIANLIASQLR